MMSADPQRQPALWTALAAASLGMVINLLFIRYLGIWLTVSGSLALLCGVAAGLAAITGRRWQQNLLLNALLVVTLLNFNGWAFSHLGNLPYFIGLFFFALFGLITGAALFRLLSQFRPVGKLPLLAAGLAAVLVSWLGGLALETSYLPADAAYYCKLEIGRLPDSLTPAQLENAVAQHIADHLARHTRTSDTLAYLYWGLTSGSVDLAVAGREQPLTYELRQSKVDFWARLAVSLLLLIYGVFSQIRWLDKTEPEALRIKIARRQKKDGPVQPTTPLP